jgi:hypothetical protein
VKFRQPFQAVSFHQPAREYRRAIKRSYVLLILTQVKADRDQMIAPYD